MSEQEKMRNAQLRKQAKIISKGYGFIHVGDGEAKMREIKLSNTQEVNLRHHEWLQYHTIEDLQDGETVLVKGVGECTVRVITSKNLVELWIVKGEEA